MSTIINSIENRVNPILLPLTGTGKEESKDSSPQQSGVKRAMDGEFKVPSPLLKKIKKEGPVTSANPEKSPPLSARTGKPLSPETVKYIEEMKRKMDEAMAARQKPQVDKINAMWQKGCQEIESPK